MKIAYCLHFAHLVATVSLTVALPSSGNGKSDRENSVSEDKTTDIHGGVKMGVIDHGCDNAKWNLHVDWDNSTNFEYSCQPTEKIAYVKQGMNMKECLNKDDIPRPIHTCMDVPITYDDTPPRGGPHRPLWPVYGEYVYLPPQRWVHALEHGAAVFLFHPCADRNQVEILRQTAQSCLRRHVITPYRQLPRGLPFAVVTWGCRLLMGTVNTREVRQFVQAKALQTYEKHVFEDGQFAWGLIHKSTPVTDMQDSTLCPKNYLESMMKSVA